ncbi:hypothetical protein [Bradyrhizobium lablabi]|uniref:hypothetical protein n=1 Tax=Bradyrhizobium lablabi TaxID=722472 RepID=UPI001BA6E130|nr:hypothetical protein [Bradyrhizobium lablabi]MBR0693074.1 hypothetical protein [Bradyrhizobium lablabi]
MSKTAAAFIVAICAPAIAFAQEGGARRLDKSPDAHKTLPSKTQTPTRGDLCASFGPGFVRMQGSDTCMKVGGGVSVGGGTSVGGR